MIVVDAGYKTPAIAKTLIDDNIEPLFPYKRPMIKKGYLKKKEFVYDEEFDIYICPEYKALKYSTTDRNGYRIYKSNPKDCINMKKLVKILVKNTSDIFDILINPLKFIKYLFENKKLGYIYIF